MVGSGELRRKSRGGVASQPIKACGTHPVLRKLPRILAITATMSARAHYALPGVHLGPGYKLKLFARQSNLVLQPQCCPILRVTRLCFVI